MIQGKKERREKGGERERKMEKKRKITVGKGLYYHQPEDGRERVSKD